MGLGPRTEPVIIASSSLMIAHVQDQGGLVTHYVGIQTDVGAIAGQLGEAVDGRAHGGTVEQREQAGVYYTYIHSRQQTAELLRPAPAGMCTAVGTWVPLCVAHRCIWAPQPLKPLHLGNGLKTPA